MPVQVSPRRQSSELPHDFDQADDVTVELVEVLGGDPVLQDRLAAGQDPRAGVSAAADPQIVAQLLNEFPDDWARLFGYDPSVRNG